MKTKETFDVNQPRPVDGYYPLIPLMTALNGPASFFREKYANNPVDGPFVAFLPNGDISCYIEREATKDEVRFTRVQALRAELHEKREEGLTPAQLDDLIGELIGLL